MTFREKLADWISGGALSRARDDAEWLDRKRDDWASLAIGHRETLHRIADMETPGANATVRRMAKTAREALE